MNSAARGLPQLGEQLFLSDTGLETDLIFHHGFALPCFAAFPLVGHDSGRKALEQYYREHAEVALQHGAGFVFEAPTWRANADWGTQLGYGRDSLRAVNREAIELMSDLRAEVAASGPSMVISGCIGPRDDAYRPSTRMSAAEARDYHRRQIETFRGSGAEMVNALTLTYPEEAIGIVQAGVDADIPAAVSFTVERDGRLPDGTPLGEAVRVTDDLTGGAAAYFGINCAHPGHIEPALQPGAPWMERVRALRANASRRSHAELDESTDLDDGNPDELAREYVGLRTGLPALTILGGCCGTDVRHLRALAAACASGPGA